eukprot:gene17787-17626_t
MYRYQGGQRELGLGSIRDVPLAAARRKAAEYREALARGTDPRTLRIEIVAPAFGVAAAELIESLRPSWKNAKHAQQWENTVAQYCESLKLMRIDQIVVDDVLKVLKPLWQRVPETASRVRMRIEKILDYARAKGWRTGENPARWKGHLDHILPPRKRLSRGHHKAMAHKDVPALVARLQGLGSISAKTLEFCILTAARSGEVLNARWSEFNLQEAIWTVPAARMKAGREHRVPLESRALAIVKELAEAKVGDYQDYTVHGFRSAFRDWASEETSFAREVAEQALAHIIENA